MNNCLQRQLALAALFCLSLPLSVRAQSFTNSATLNAALDGTGTNLVVSYSLMNTQGWVTLFQAGSLQDIATNAQPFDLAPASATGQGQFTVPISSAAPSQFYRLLIEQWPSRGKAFVFTNGPYDFAAMRQTYGDITNSVGSTNSTPVIFKQPVQVWVDNLGTYDTNGVLVGGNAGKLWGKYARTDVYPFNNPYSGFPPIGVLVAPSNDFRVNYAGDASIPKREALLWSSEVQIYHDGNEYRNRFVNDAFVDELGLPPDIAANLKQRQFRPDLDMSVPPRFGLPNFQVLESIVASSIELLQEPNLAQFSAKTRGPYLNYDSLPPWSVTYDSGVSVGDYAGLMAAWVLGTPKGFPSDAFYGQEPHAGHDNVLSPVSNGLSAWVAYLISGDPEVYRNCDYANRIWGGRPCGGTNIPCDKGDPIRNVMMFDEANTSKDGVFPYTWPSGNGNLDGPVASDLAALFIAGTLYDIANEAGLGLHKTDLLIWKTISLVNNTNFYTDAFGRTYTNGYIMRQFGATMQQAARALWPDPRPGRAGLSLYEEDIADVLTSRGIPLNGVSDFRTNLPPAINSLIDSTGLPTSFESSHPNSQPGINFYGNHSLFTYRYVETNAADYVAFQLYKHSKHGPCDRVAITDGSFTVGGSAPFNWSYNSNGTFYTELVDRELGNVVVLLPGRTNRWLNSRQRCPNEATGFYAEDVRPFGFSVIKATPNGFSFTASALSETATNKTYQLSIVDPSLVSLGAASYAWSFTNYDGTFQTATGTNVQYTALKDQPFTMSIARTRASQTDTLTLRERGNDLDRNGGHAFVRNLVP